MCFDLCCACISTGQVGVVENCSKFSHVARPGLNCFAPFICMIKQKVSLRIQQINVQCETKTKDNSFVNVEVAVQYRVIDDNNSIRDSVYKLENASRQISTYVNDVIRSAIPKLSLEQAFESKADLANDVMEQLDSIMQNYGFQIKQTLIIDLSPDARVKDSMNQLNASARLREAAANKAEADKILMVKAAEAEADSKALSGKGVAKQRQAIIGGLKSSISEFSEVVSGTTSKDVMNLLLLTQYFDMLKEISAKTQKHSVFLDHTPNTVHDLQTGVKNMFMSR